MQGITRVFLVLCRLAIGVLFTFSGFVKAIDPLGSTYKFMDYFEAFGMTFLSPIALYLGILLAAAELVIGLCMLMGIRMKATSWAGFIFMVFFTVLTFFLAVFNPVSDCGCFGDAIKLTNWQTFFKNLILLPITGIILWGRNKYVGVAHPGLEWLYVIAFFVGSFFLSSYCYKHLPLLDFMPYYVGQNIPKAMEVPEGAVKDEFRTVLIYEKDGVQQEFTDADFPWQDTTWTFIDSKSVLVTKGYEPPIYNFSITHPEEGDITEEILQKEYAFLLVAPKIEDSNWEDLNRIKEVANYAVNHEYTFVGLTSSTQGQAGNFVSENGLGFEFCSTDATTLKSVVRSNPGLALLYKGTIIGKWSARDIPPVEYFENNMLSTNINTLRQHSENNLTRAWIAGGILVLVLLSFFGYNTRGADSKSHKRY